MRQKHYFCSPNRIIMKKIFLTLAIAATMVACGQQGDKTQQQAEQNPQKVVIPPGMPTPPVSQPINPNAGLAQDPNPTPQDPNKPILKMEEGKPLDLSQLMGPKKSMEEMAVDQIDTIRYKAEHGDAEYQYFYGACYDNGWGVETDHAQAMNWYQKAANQGQKSSFNAIGNLYRVGQGVKQDDKSAFSWFKKGSEVKDSQAMLNLGNCYYYGKGTVRNLNEAIVWWSESAKLGNAYALAQMGDCYLYGRGVEKDLDKAVDCLKKAADKNVAGAQFRLGILYYTGQGVEQDQVYSELLMKKARDGGMKEAQDFLDRQFKK